MTMLQLYLVVALAPLVGAIVVGLWGPRLGRSASHWICIVGVAISTVGVGVHPARRDGRQHLQRRHLRLDDVGRHQVRGRLPHRPADRVDARRRHLRFADGAYLHHRLHGRRSGLHALLLVHLPVHLQHADAGDGEQFPAAVLRLGSGGAGVLPADRLLVRAPDRDLRQPQGIPRQPRRRFRLCAGHRPYRRLHRIARLRQRVRGGPAS